MNRNCLATAALSLGLATVPAACRAPVAPSPTPEPVVTPAEEIAALDDEDLRTALPDDAITRAIERELLYDGSVSPQYLTVETNDGIVELRGSVEQLLAKERATELALAVRGVRAVSNRLELEVAARPDRQLVADVEESLLLDPSTEAFQIEVEAHDGRVVLTGSVESWQEKQLAKRVAQGVKGVREVVNRVTVAIRDERPDREIADDVESRLRWDALVDHELIDVSVDEGYVTLDGSVGSAAEAMRAQADAWVAGVRGVDGSALQVRWWSEDEYLRKPPVAFESDAAIAAAIEDAARYDPRVRATRIEPVVNERHVTLLGTVSSLRAKRAAERLAHDTAGVLGVTNELAIGDWTPIPDRTLRTRVRRGLRLSPVTEPFDISAAVSAGTVTLTGTVDTYAQRAKATEIAGSIAGVSNVDDRLAVRRPIAPYVPSPTPGTDAPWRMYVPSDRPMRGETLHREIVRELLWDPYVDVWQVRVTVRGSRAILTGTVDSWVERFQAQINALQAGARSVDNRLEVR